MADLKFETNLQAAARQAYFWLDTFSRDRQSHVSPRARKIADDLRKALAEEGALTAHEAGSLNSPAKDSPHD